MRTGTLIIGVLLAIALPAIIADDANATAGDSCEILFYFNGESAKVAAVCGEVPDPGSIAEYIAMGTWHLADGTPWDPQAPVPDTLTNGVLPLALDAPPAPAEPMDPVIIVVPIIAAAIVIMVLALGYRAVRRP